MILCILFFIFSEGLDNTLEDSKAYTLKILNGNGTTAVLQVIQLLTGLALVLAITAAEMFSKEIGSVLGPLRIMTLKGHC